MNKVTGQLMFRETNSVIDGRKIVMVFGLIAANKGEDINMRGEHQYDVVGMDVLGDLRLQVIQASEVDRTETNRGSTPSQLLMEPLWRI